jgi:hypothetical protein
MEYVEEKLFNYVHSCHADDVNSLGEDVSIIKTLAVLDASKEVGLGVNAEKTKYVFMSCHQTTGQNHI